MQKSAKIKARGRISFLLCGLVLMVFLCSPVFAAPAYNWNIPGNVRIVQKDSVDGVRTFSTIQQALNSITNASATNPYLIKVMPGVYNEAVTMKEYVDLEGSGPENTVITSSVLSDYTCSAATVKAANNAALRHVRIKNIANAPSSNMDAAIAVLFDNVTSSADDVSVDVGLEGAVTAENTGICVKGSNASVFLSHIDVHVKNESYDYQADALGIRLRDSGKIILKDSRVFTDGGINVNNSQWSSAVNALDAGGTVEIMGCSLESINGSDAETVYTGNSNVVIASSRVFAYNGKSNTYALRTSGNTRVSNGTIYAMQGRGVRYSICFGSGITKIANSLIDGPVDGCEKLINNYTSAFDLIPNQ